MRAIEYFAVARSKVELFHSRRVSRMRKPEKWTDVLWRYRGVMVVAAIPVLLVIVIILLVPRASPIVFDQPHTLKELQHKGSMKYAIVVDAGSTGSRVHVFKFDTGKGALDLISDTFEQLKPGLSSYADNPVKAAESLKPLLDIALKTVPAALQKTTPLSVKATAGLRLLPEGKADKILAAVSDYLKQYPFVVKPGAVAILDGTDEGGFAWLTLNYLLGNLGKDPKSTVSAIDLGGGSVQEASALPDAEAKTAPKGYVTQLKGGGKVYNVYVHSYLGFGLMAGRAAILGQKTDQHPCFENTGSNGKTYKYAGKEYAIKGMAAASFATCQEISTTVFSIGKECGAPKELCSFNGAWRGPSVGSNPAVYVSSYFWDRAVEAGIVADKEAIEFKTSAKEFSTHASKVCSSQSAAVKQQYPRVDPESAHFFCLDLTYCHTLLTKAFKIPEAQQVTLVKQVKYNGQNIEAAWPLGAAVNELS